MDSDNICACAHQHVRYHRIEHRAPGTYSDSWKCDDCNTPFAPMPTPGCSPPAAEHPAPSGSEPRPAPTMEQAREQIGRIMHESWSRTKRAQRFHGPNDFCTQFGTPDGTDCSHGLVRCDKFHADLIPWEQLPEKQKDINRHAFDDVLASGLFVLASHAHADLRAENQRLRTELTQNYAADKQTQEMVVRIEAENERLRQEIIDWEEREASACPEDVGFEELLQARSKEIDRLIGQVQSAESTLAKLREYAVHKAGCGIGNNCADSLGGMSWRGTEHKWRDCTCGLAALLRDKERK